MSEVRVIKSKPLVSIIIPVYNKAVYVAEALDSALAQSYPNTEIILVDDGSTDGSFEILKTYFEKFPDKINLIDQENQGVSAATNRGIQAAKGEYIQFLDADDLLSPDKIANQMGLLQNQAPEVMASCDWVIFKDDISRCSRLPYGVFVDFESGLDLLLRFWNYQEMMAISSWLTNRSLIEKAGLWDETLTINQDGEFFCRVLVSAKKIIYESKGKVFYRQPEEGNVSQQKSFKAAESLLDSYCSYEKNVFKVERSERVKKSLKKVYQKFLYDIYPEYPELLQQAKNRIRDLGINEKTFIGGPKFRLLSKLLGFETALRFKRFLS